MKQCVYGYVRVSSRDQNEARQLVALKPYQIPAEHIFIDKLSGKDFNRPEYRRLLRKTREGDLIIVKSIDRLGRNYEEILEQWQLITKKLKADILVIDMPLLDTRARDGSLTGIFISDLVLQILSYVAQTERENIRQRQREGIQAAKAQRVKFGRPRLEKPKGYLEIFRRIRSGTLTITAGAQYLGISPRTLKRWMEEEKVG
ncbi:MAG: recombinase family protein [Clostridium sp.]|nr:recombinase family protein [Clostridium sp.]